VVHITHILVHPRVRCAHRLKTAALSPMSIKGSGPQTVGLGPIVGRIGPPKRKFDEHWIKATADAADMGKLYNVCCRHG